MFRYVLFWSIRLLCEILITSITAVWASIGDLIIIFFSVNSFCKNAMLLWRACIFLFWWPSDIFVYSVKDSIWFLSVESFKNILTGIYIQKCWMAIARRECVNIDVFIGVTQACVRSYGRACEIGRNGVRCFWRNYWRCWVTR